MTLDLFDGNGTLTRAEVCVIISNLLKILPEDSYENYRTLEGESDDVTRYRNELNEIRLKVIELKESYTVPEYLYYSEIFQYKFDMYATVIELYYSFAHVTPAEELRKEHEKLSDIWNVIGDLYQFHNLILEILIDLTLSCEQGEISFNEWLAEYAAYEVFAEAWDKDLVINVNRYIDEANAEFGYELFSFDESNRLIDSNNMFDKNW